MCFLRKQHRHYSKLMVSNVLHKQDIRHHHILPSCPADGAAARWARDTLTTPRVWVKTDRSWARRCNHCGCCGWVGSSASPPHSCGDTLGPGNVLSLSEPSHQWEHLESSRPQRTWPGTRHAVEEEGTTGYFDLKTYECQKELCMDLYHVWKMCVGGWEVLLIQQLNTVQSAVLTHHHYTTEKYSDVATCRNADYISQQRGRCESNLFFELTDWPSSAAASTKVRS